MRLISAHMKFDSLGQDQLFYHTKVPLRSEATRKNKVLRMVCGSQKKTTVNEYNLFMEK